jgi:putative DNA primase/helicase
MSLNMGENRNTPGTDDPGGGGTSIGVPSVAPSPDRFIDKRDGLLTNVTTDAVREHFGPFAVDRSGRLYVYTRDGQWSFNGQRTAEMAVHAFLGDRYRKSHSDTVVKVLTLAEPTVSDGNINTEYLNLPNGLLHWRTGQLYQHSPDIMVPNRIPVPWNPAAVCPMIQWWVNQVVPPDCVNLVFEIIGYCLFNGNPLHKAILLSGTGRNGKGTLLRLIQALIGAVNISSVSPQALDDNRFSVAELFGKLVNLAGDVDPKIFKATETFKKATGGDLLFGERKYGQPFDFTCRALIIAGFNALPRSADTSEGFFSRWIVLPFTGYFPAGKADPTVEARMHTASELQGLLVLAVSGLQRLMARGHFEMPPSVVGAIDHFKRVADPVRAFMADETEGTVGHFENRTMIYRRYESWVSDNGHNPLAQSAFYERFEGASIDVYGHRVTPRKRDGVRGYIGLGLLPSEFQRAADALRNDTQP